MLRRFDPASAPPPGPPPRSLSLLAAILGQLRLFREPLRRRRFRAQLAAAPGGEGVGVLVLPGMGVGDLSTLTLRRFLVRHRFDARRWRLGRHRPDVPRTLARLLPRLESVAAETGGAVGMVGWSLGGVLARELARLRPDLVRHVVTLGAPLHGFRGTAIAGLFRVQGWDLDDVAARVEAAARTPIRVPVTAIWSRRDGIVDWRAAVDTATPGIENLEATSCHWGLGLDPEVLVAIAEGLASAPRSRPRAGGSGSIGRDELHGRPG